MLNMIEIKGIATEIKTARPDNVSASTKDTGKVKVGGSSIRFADASASIIDKGRVRVGGSSIRF